MQIPAKDQAAFVRHPSLVVRYGVAVASVAVVLALKLLLDPLIEVQSPFLLLAAAVMIGAWFGGLGPGLLATVLGVLAVNYFFLAPIVSFTGLGLSAMPLLLFTVQGLLISSLTQALRSARERAVASQTSLRQSEERFRLLVEGVEDYAIFMLDTEGHVTTWNEGAKRTNGYRAEEIVGKHFSIFYTQEDIERGHPEWELRVAIEQGRYEEEGVRVRKDGSRFWANVLITALRDEEGKVRGFAKVVRDITQRKEAEEKLKQMREAERSRIARDLHDGVLQDLAIAVQRLGLARRMQAQSGDLEPRFDPQQEIDAIRKAVSGIREAIYDLRHEKEESFVRAVESLVESNRQLTPEREITLTTQDEFPPELPGRMGMELLRIVQEALTNTRCHSAALNVWVVLGVEEENLVVEVADDGRGFDPEAPKGGVGIEGIRERASLIGGDAEVRSESGKGTTVRIKVPLS